MFRIQPFNALILAVLAAALTPYIILDPKSLFFHYAMVYIYFVLLAMAWNTLYSSTGMVTLGLQLYFGVSAYATAFLVNQSINIILASAAGFLAAVLLSVAVSFLLIKLRGLSFTIGSWMFAEGAMLIMLNVPWLGGSQGYGIPTVQVPVKELYAVSVVLLVGVYYFMRVFMQSRFGFGSRGIKLAENLAGVMGLNVPWYKIITLTVCNSAAALSGVVYMLYVKYTDPYTSFQILWSIESIIMSVIGGVNTLVGPFIGGTVFLVIVEYIRFLYAELNILIMGAIMMAFGLLYKEGVMGFVNRYRARRVEASTPRGKSV
ncbi:MAG: branched-chain amino acid ABC transporter permease [Candidatus Caldarchaeum sp.]|nr:branched-chain amino acid ABC transporter permease [Candidatus Caldarchaeum sp.]MDW8359887.1 branched-chain amino acid ABC transporter permease [Candidatus Caldarchaeum sp.]